MFSLPRETWESLAQDERRQLVEEGRDLAAAEQLVQRCRREERLDERLWREGQELPLQADWPYEEPASLEQIVSARAGPIPVLPVDRDRLADRLYGAWLGRCAGCMLGKPVEGRSRQQLRTLLAAAGEYPLRDYFPPLKEVPENIPYPPPDSPLLRGNIVRAERDDDTDYPVLNLLVWQRRGADFSPEQIGAAWLEYLPYHRVYTAERAAYRNLVNEVPPPESALLFNPYREWIGAQIRADFWGYVAPGQLGLAAEFGWRDACISHVKNGIYGEMFFAALIAACLASGDFGQALEAARRCIPARSRFAEVVQDCVDWCAADGEWERTRDRVEQEYGHYHSVHTLNNAALVLIALLYADGDFGKAIGLAVQGGWDTDCNGATAGSVWGALYGAEAIPTRWAEPLGDTLISAVFGHKGNSIATLANSTAELAVVP